MTTAFEKLVQNSVDNKVTPLRTISEAEKEVAALRSALKAYILSHDETAHDLGVDADMDYPPNECDCILCKQARKALEAVK
jgi:hypothetical protein